MNTTARILTGWITVAMSFSAGIASAGLPSSAAALGVGAACVSQIGSSGSGATDRRQQSDDFLRRARELMAQNDLAGAEVLISQAEALGVEYSALSFSDTPKNARRDLNRMRGAASGSTSMPSQLFSPLGGAKKAAPADPFMGRTTGAAIDPTQINAQPAPPAVMPTMGRPDAASTGLSPMGQPAVMAPPSQNDLRLPPALADRYSNAVPTSNPMREPRNMGTEVPMPYGSPNMGPIMGPAPTGPWTPNASADRARSDQLLRGARVALAVGDVRRAADLTAQARQQQVRYAPNDDTPERVEAAIARYQEVDRLDKSTEGYRRSYARMLMEQSESLLQCGEYEQADQLAAQAARQQVAWGPLDAKPEDLLKRIAGMRQQNVVQAPHVPLYNGQQSLASSKSTVAKQQTADLIRQGRQALAAGQLDRAEYLARRAEQVGVPDSAYSPGEDRPGLLLLDIRQARMRNPSGVVPAGGTMMPDRGATQAVYDPSSDSSRNVQVATEEPAIETVPLPPATPIHASATTTPEQSPGYALFQQGEAALKERKIDRAYELFQQAKTYMSELDPTTAQRLQDKLQLLSVQKNRGGNSGQSGSTASPIDEAVARQQALAKQVMTDVAHRENDAKSMREKDPKMALTMLQETRKKVEAAGLETSARDQLLRRLDRSIADMQHYIDQNRPRIELNERNSHTVQDIQREAAVKHQNEEKLKELVDKFNRLMQEERYAEAEVIAKQAAELVPKSPIVEQMQLTSKIARHLRNAIETRNNKAENFGNQMQYVDIASTPPADDESIHFPEAAGWRQMTTSRRNRLRDHHRRRTEREIEIEKKLQTPVSFAFRATPLSQALDKLAKYADVNIHLDEEGLKQEGLSPDMPVTLEVSHEIMLKSALNLLLENHHLCYVIKDEVLKVTSEQMRSGQYYTVTYPVGDLVMPIPNFVPSQMGLERAYHTAVSNSGMGGPSAFGTAAAPMVVQASRDAQKNSNAVLNPAVMANFAARQPTVGGPAQPGPGGPGGLASGTGADFESLVELITQTISPNTWDSKGGHGTIGQFEANLSLVVSQTQEVHEELVDLLEQLRRMQDLQITIEVRFITLNDNFFERIGVDFDFNIRKNIADPQAAGFSAPQPQVVNGQNIVAPLFGGSNGTSVVGLQQIGNNPAQSGIFTTDLDIPVRQGSFALAVPQFGGFDAAAGASLGFAILSDIEAFFFINAAQGDKRTNILQAPKVTLFNGQQAFVSDTSQTPFVISVIPVVGDFAAAQQPVIVVLSEGTFMTVQAVVSNDRRFVRLTIVPFFSKIGNVNTFTFQGTNSTTTDTTQNGLLDPAKNLFNNNTKNTQSTTSGVTVQLPTFSFVTVTTTVSVPDGGTVLLGGIKRLSEGRTEFGVPILDKIPYLNRLFKNVGIGRETSSLMMMVTPRIIIQEEEEEKMGIQSGP